MEEKNKFYADKSYSTYYWRFRFDKTNPLERGIMEGYSKGHGDEAADKAGLLKDKILMLYRNKNNYFSRMLDVTFHMKKGTFFDKQDCYQLFTMRRDGFELGTYYTKDPNNYERFLKTGMSRWMYDFYDSVLKKKDTEFLKPVKKPEDNFSKDDLLDVTKVKIRDMKHLNTYVAELAGNGHNFTAVMEFYKLKEEELTLKARGQTFRNQGKDTPQSLNQILQ